MAGPGAAMAAELADRVAGDVRFDAYSRAMYATDASIYRVVPIGVVMPRSSADVVAVMEYAAARGVPVLPRGAGTSLAGQAVGRAIVLDFSRYMAEILAIDAATRTVRVQPGVTLGRLNAALAPHGLKFGPDPAAGDRSVVGGAIGNNSSGAHSLVYGKTDAYVRELTLVLADGRLATFGEVPLAQLVAFRSAGTLEGRLYGAVGDLLAAHRDELAVRFPPLKRNVSGYNLDAVIRDGSLNLARLITGSEGTLGMVVEATLDLEPLPAATGLALLSYGDLLAALEAVEEIVATGAAAVEVLDEVVLDLAAGTPAFRELVGLLPAGTRAVLLVEYYGERDADVRERVAALVASQVGGGGRAFAAREAYTAAERERFWRLRRAGLPILLSRTGDAKHIAFIEDTAIPPQHLPAYVRDFQQILAEHETHAAFFAHAGPGVLHIRPLLNTKESRGLERMHAIAAAVTDLVVKYGGAVSGEHGDGRARTQWNRKLYGETIWNLFQEIKDLFDPDWLLNPGQVVTRDEAVTDLRENLRFDPGYRFQPEGPLLEPNLHWENENGLQGMVELCHGCGGCRTMEGGVMCPTFRATREEIASTRGRANLLREAMSGGIPVEELLSDAFYREVMALCIGCKGCKMDCPSQVDMARLKAEVEYRRNLAQGVPLRSRLFARVRELNAWGSRLAPAANLLPRLPGAPWLLERTLGLAPLRPLPRFAAWTLSAWFAARGCRVPAEEARARVQLLVDCHTNFCEPQVGQAAVRVLEAAGVHVVLFDVGCCGRPAFSQGMLDLARTQARRVVQAAEPLVAAGWELVALEPSCVSALQDDYRALLGPSATAVAGASHEVMEYLERLRAGERLEQPEGAPPPAPVTYHGHCHQKAAGRQGDAARVLAHYGYQVETLASGCCGMAGSFGYEAEHYGLSMAIGQILFDQVRRSGGERVTAPGVSCRGQLRDGLGIPVSHPVELVAERLAPRC